jgi:hypothetical protein
MFVPRQRLWQAHFQADVAEDRHSGAHGLLGGQGGQFGWAS